MLAHYAGRLETVEANATFYRMPRPEMLAGWRAEVPAGFVFALKAPRRVTHVRRLRDVEGELAAFYAAAAELGASLGPVLYQLPPSLKRDLPRLEDFLATLPSGGRAAFEFRDASWLEDETLAALSSHGAAACAVDAREGATPLVATADFGYVRLRREDYAAADLRAWAERILSQRWSEAFVYFKHEDQARGPALAAALREVMSGLAGAADPHPSISGPGPRVIG